MKREKRQRGEGVKTKQDEREKKHNNPALGCDVIEPGSNYWVKDN